MYKCNWSTDDFITNRVHPTLTLEELESSTSRVEHGARRRAILAGTLAAAITIHAMSSVYFLCHFGTCCQSCVWSFLYMHFISERSYGTRATPQSVPSGHVARPARGHTLGT